MMYCPTCDNPEQACTCDDTEGTEPSLHGSKRIRPRAQDRAMWGCRRVPGGRRYSPTYKTTEIRSEED